MKSMMAKELMLPWPSRDLHPNSRIHWAKRAVASRDARLAAYLSALYEGWNKGVKLPAGRLHLWIDFYPPDRRKRDDDGLLSSFKPHRDGIADALGIDDNRFVSHPYVQDEIRKGGEVRVRLSMGSSDE